MKTCLGHIRGTCPDCKEDEYNKHCPAYVEVEIRKVVVIDVVLPEKEEDTEKEEGV